MRPCAWILAIALSALVQPCVRADTPLEFKRLVVYSKDQRDTREKLLNAVGYTSKDVGRSFLLLAGVSKYPNLSEPTLEPAAEDLRKLYDYFKTVERFDEIVVLQNADMNLRNFEYFLQTYFPERLKRFPKSRFVFAYSGHGFNDSGLDYSYLLQSNARDGRDKSSSVNVQMLRVLVNEVVNAGHHVLVLINACHGGAFLNRRSFAERRLIPRNPGAHAITAGSGGELTYHDNRYGSGSIFFEKFLAGLDGRADRYPQGGDGVVTVDELYAYLRQEIQLATDQQQTPQLGDITRDGALGSLFFLNRRQLVDGGTILPWDPSKARSYSVSALAAMPSHPRAPEPRSQVEIRPGQDEQQRELAAKMEAGNGIAAAEKKKREEKQQAEERRAVVDRQLAPFLGQYAKPDRTSGMATQKCVLDVYFSVPEHELFVRYEATNEFSYSTGNTSGTWVFGGGTPTNIEQRSDGLQLSGTFQLDTTRTRNGELEHQHVSKHSAPFRLTLSSTSRSAQLELTSSDPAANLCATYPFYFSRPLISR